MAGSVVIGLSAVVIAIQDGEAVALTVRPQDMRTRLASILPGLPSGPFFHRWPGAPSSWRSGPS